MKGHTQQIMIFKNGRPVGTFDNLTKAGNAVKVSKTTVSLLLRTGKETKKGYSFDYGLWD